jgi:predicted metalloprotease with PDZ domain
MNTMKRIALIYILTPFFTLQIIAQQIHYTVSFANAAHNEAKIVVQVTGAKTPVLTFRMSRSSPGRYATHEFGKNVYDVQASDGQHPLSLQRTDGDIYQVSGIKGTVILQYTLFGNHAEHSPEYARFTDVGEGAGAGSRNHKV